MNTVIIKYNAGNIRSVQIALQRIGVESNVSDNLEEIQKADRIIFPGVGEASSAMNYLRDKKLDLVIKSLKQPVLGICLGMQLMCAHSEENNADCLGIFDYKVKKFESSSLKIPQIGWNNIFDLHSPLFEGIAEDSFVYFVHSYYVENCENAISKTNYICDYSSALHKNNFYALQYHPEKSGLVGERILRNFFEKIN